MARYMLGNELPPELQQHALVTFGKDRFTGEYRPSWLDGASVDPHVRNGPPFFKDDAEWLSHTEFPVSGKGDRLHLARNGLRHIVHYIHDVKLKGAGDEMVQAEAERLALLTSAAAGRPVWVLVEGRVGDMTFSRPSTGLPSMWRVATPTGELY